MGTGVQTGGELRSGTFGLYAGGENASANLYDSGLPEHTGELSLFFRIINIRNLFALLVSTILLVLGLLFSVVIISAIAVLGLAAWAYFWWKTRKLRKTMREQAPDGMVIDGEASVVEEYAVGATNAFPGRLVLADIDLSTDPLAARYVKTEVVTVEFAGTAGELISLEGPNRYDTGDALITGSTGTRWSVARERFDAKYEALPGEDGRYQAKPIPVLARQMHEAFSAARSSGGDLLQGDAGDWLLQYGPGDFGVAKNERFTQVYRKHILESDTPNALTAETLRKSREGEDVFRTANASDLFKQLGKL